MQRDGGGAASGSVFGALETKKNTTTPSIVFPFASISVLVILMTLFVMALEWGGWTWSSWTYALSFVILAPLVLLESNRRVIITGGGFVILILMVLIDAGMPGYFGYGLSDYDFYDKFAHYAGAAGITLFLWSVIWWTISPSGPPKVDGRKILIMTVVAMIALSTFFKFSEYIGDFLYGFKNAHDNVDTVGDLIFNLAGIAAAAIVIGRHNLSVLKRPFWHAEH